MGVQLNISNQKWHMQKIAHELIHTNVLLPCSTAFNAEVYAISMNALHLNCPCSTKHCLKNSVKTTNFLAKFSLFPLYVTLHFTY